MVSTRITSDGSKAWPPARLPASTNRTVPAKFAPRAAQGDNADAHLKRQVIGREVMVVAVIGGSLDGFALLTKIFGPWEQILYGEFDGRRRKRVLVKIIGEQVTTQSSGLRTTISAYVSATLIRQSTVDFVLLSRPRRFTCVGMTSG